MSKPTEEIFRETPSESKTDSSPGGHVDGAGFWIPRGVTLVPLGRRTPSREWDPFAVDGTWRGPFGK